MPVGAVQGWTKSLHRWVHYSESFVGLGIGFTLCVCAWIAYREHGGLALTVKLFFLAFSGLGAFCSVFISADTGLGAQWIVGLTTIPDLFLAIGGMLAGIRLIIPIFAHCFNWFRYIGSNPAVAASMFIAVDMGGNKLSKQLSTDPVTGQIDVSQYYTANILGYSLGDLVCFAIPVGLAMIRTERQRQYFMLGMVPGIIATPIGSIVTYAIWWWQQPMVSTHITSNPVANVRLEVHFVRDSLACLIPCWGIGFLCMALATYKVEWLVIVFQRFGDALNLLIRSFFWLAMVQYFGQQAWLFPSWLQMEPLLSTSDSPVSDEAGLEIAGSIGCILTGVYPFILVLRERLLPQILRFGHLLGFHDPEGHGILGVIGSMTNTICLFQMYPKIRDKDEAMMASAFIVSGGYILGDFLVYSSIYQPTILGPLMLGKFVGGVVSCFAAKYTVCRLELPDIFDDEEEAEEVGVPRGKSTPLPSNIVTPVTPQDIGSLHKTLSAPEMSATASARRRKSRTRRPSLASTVRTMSLRQANKMFRMDPHLEDMVVRMNAVLPTPAQKDLASLLAHFDQMGADEDDDLDVLDSKAQLAADILRALAQSGSGEHSQQGGMREPLLADARH